MKDRRSFVLVEKDEQTCCVVLCPLGTVRAHQGNCRCFIVFIYIPLCVIIKRDRARRDEGVSRGEEVC
ncbi:hypothetical protein EI42_00023 [Thermosporothrix hazakensis]|uniref:Uncharacterized protein n=1 Tax=Thermosporothrix hazakensis TaxID=644383 RepID=A0A326UFS0_THEHA|nr:hypothetical protein EI42_00023 [Thermosporothrix hazakensis]